MNDIIEYTRDRGATVLLAVLLAACEVVPEQRPAKQDTTTAPASGQLAAVPDSNTATGGVPAVPSDSVMPASDSGVVLIEPARPTRGGVLRARAPGLAMQTPRCTWRGEAVACYSDSTGVTAYIPLSADLAAGTYVLTIDRPVGRISRQVAIADRDFGREVIMLDSARWALVRRGSDIARDSRALRQILAAESPARRWRGRWRDPVAGKASGFGTERIYAPSSDSSKVIPLDFTARGLFASDTSGSGKYPSWRHSGADIAAAARTAVVAPAAAIVADVGEYTLTGRTVVLDHGQGLTTAYFHLDTATVRRGDEVKAGERIGRVGTTGLSTGPHLHFGVYLHGQPVDPAAWKAVTEATGSPK